MVQLAALLRSLAESDDVAYAITAERTLLRTNPGWTRFALANGGAALLERWGRGANIDEAIPPPLRAFYGDAFARALGSGERWEHDYECSSPETYRQLRMVVYPVERRFMVVVHSLRVEKPIEREVCLPSDPAYAVGGVITMCSHCRRVRNAAGLRRWDWVPAYVETPPPNLSHGLCESCVAFYYGDIEEAAPAR